MSDACEVCGGELKRNRHGGRGWMVNVTPKVTQLSLAIAPDETPSTRRVMTCGEQACIARAQGT